MDWIKQNKFNNILILVLLLVNAAAVSVIWIQTIRKPDEPPPQSARPAESSSLIKRELDLNDAQIQQFDKLRSAKLDLIKTYNDSLAALKNSLAEDLFNEKMDTLTIVNRARHIGDLQAKVELLRFQHFRDLLAICQPAQKEKLKPILKKVFGKTPPKEIAMDVKEPGAPEERKDKNLKPIDEAGQDSTALRENPAPPRKDGPPTIEEKLLRYTDKLNLSEDQKKKVNAIFMESEVKHKRLREIPHADRNSVEAEKRKIRENEDDAVLKILDSRQKEKFGRMIENRKK